MADIKNLRWRLVLGLGAFALIRPVLHMTGAMDALGMPLAPILATVGISVVWIAVVVGARIAQPLLTLVFVGLTYGVLSILLSAVLSPVLTGELQGPLATGYGFAVIPVLSVNAVWGAVAGVIASAFAGARNGSSHAR